MKNPLFTMSLLTHFSWDTPCGVWFACCKDVYTLYGIVTKQHFYWDATSLLQTKTRLLILSRSAMPLVSMSSTRRTAHSWALARLSLGLYLRIFMFGFVLFTCFPSNRVPWLRCCHDCCLNRFVFFLIEANILAPDPMVCLHVQCL